jgi:hypothetical protein
MKGGEDYFDTEVATAALGYFVIKACVESDKGDAEWRAGMAYGASNTDEAIGLPPNCWTLS